MAKKTQRSSVLAKLGNPLTKAILDHKDDETVFDTGGRLPENIENGIARLTECKFDVYKKGPNKGKPYFYAAGTVVSPEEHEGVKCKGRTTSIMEPLCDTKTMAGKVTSLADHTDKMLNHLRLLGVETAEFSSPEDLENAAEALKEAAPFFRFRTWKGQPTAQFKNPRVNEVWMGATNYVEDGEDAVEDDTDSDGGDDDGTDDDVAAFDEDDMNSVAKAADDGDEDAQTLITERLKGVKLKPDKFKTWKLAVKALLAAEEAANEDDEDEPEDDTDDEDADTDEAEAEESDEEEEEEDETPAVGDIWMFKPPGTKKKVEVEIMSVQAKAQTCTVKNLDDNKSYKAVAFTALTPAAE